MKTKGQWRLFSIIFANLLMYSANAENPQSPQPQQSGNQNGHENHPDGSHGENSPTSFDYKKCEKGQKGVCFGYPNKCYERKNCAFVVHIEKDSSSYYNYTLFKTDEKDVSMSYVSVGISEKTNMKESILVACLNGNVENDNVRMYWSKDAGRPIVLATSGEADFVHNTRSLHTDNDILCTFQQKSNFKVKVAEGTYNFDLDKKKYILLAIGKLKAVTASPGHEESEELVYHHNKTISELLFLDGRPNSSKDKNNSNRYYTNYVLLALCFAFVTARP